MALFNSRVPGPTIARGIRAAARRARSLLATLEGTPNGATSNGEVRGPAAGRELDDEAFVDWCYEHVLGRKPDAAGREAWLRHLSERRDRLEVLRGFVESEEHRSMLTRRQFVPPGHFYSPIPSDEDIERHRRFNWQKDSLPGIDLRPEAQLELLERFAKGYPSLPFHPEATPGLRYKYENPTYSYSDAIFLASMIRDAKPRRIIEVGSGNSSCATLDTNDAFFQGNIECTFIEPYPEYLHSLLSQKEARSIRLLESKLQDVPLSEFERLEANDILFIDSTHVSRLGSDVNYTFFEILPRLKKGVLIHIHDVFFPFEYPFDWVAEGRAWNEQYVLRAFLEFNRSFEIALFGTYMISKHRDWFERNMPLCLKNSGGSIWLRKTA